MPISFVGAGPVTSGVINPVVELPAGIQDGDLLLLIVNVGSGSVVNTPPGWTSTFSIGSSPNYLVFNRFEGGPNGPAVNISLSSGNSTITAVIIAYRGVSAINAISTAAAANSTTIASNTLTTTYNNEYVVTVYGMAQGAATWTAPGSTTTLVDASGTAAATGLLVVDELLTTAGVSIARTATSSVSKQLSVRSFSLIPSGRYWVGGTDIWNGTAGTKWSFSSGGTGGAPVPAQADDVFLDANSGVSTVTIDISNTGAKSINCTGFTGTLAGSANITVNGSVTLAAGMTHTYTGTLTLLGTGTLTSAGKTLGPVTVNGAGITVTLGDALNIGSRALTITQGTFTTNNFNVTVGSFSSSNSSNTRVVNLGSSTITVTQAGSAWATSLNTNFTLNAGTSTIVFTGNGVTFVTGDASGIGQTYYNISLTNTTVSNHVISGVCSFNNFSVAAPSSAGVTAVSFSTRQTINGTLSTTGTAGNSRVWFRGATYGLAQTLTVNATPSLTDADFRDIIVQGTAVPISGTRIGDLRGCSGITFSTPKTVYWNLAAGGNWSANAWAASSGGGVSTDNFPLAQDTATFVNTGLNSGATVVMDTAIVNVSGIDASARTNSMSLTLNTNITTYGNFVCGSGITFSGGLTLTFSGRNTQTITSAGKTLGNAITVDSYGGSVELADALNVGGNTPTVTNGTFDTKNYAVNCGNFFSFGTAVRSIRLGASSLNMIGGFSINSTNLTFDAGTSTITSGFIGSFDGAGFTFYDVFLDMTALPSKSLTGANTFRNLTLIPPSLTGFGSLLVEDNQTITGTLTVAGASPVRRIFVRSNTIGTQRTLNVGTLSADDCDFRDIAITGTAAGSSPTRAGDCGGNSGITFPAPKTVYWNLAGAQNWSATGWAPSSGGTPDINNFPLAQDTAVFDDTGSVTGTITVNAAWKIGTFDASARTSAMTLTTSSNLPLVHGDWKFGTGVTSSSSTGTITFAKRGTQTITSNGVQFGCPVTIDCVTGTVQLADALSLDSTRTLTLTSGTFDAVTYNVTIGSFNFNNINVKTIKMGSGTWTLSGTGTLWIVSTTNTAFYKGTANIVLSDTSTSARTFGGGGLSYNKLTIGGTTGTSTLTINGNNQFTELASTKTVAHTIALGSTTQTFGKWTVTGTAGNVVTLTGTGTSHILAGACTDGIDYLAMGSIGFSVNSPGEFYAGANSTGTASAPVYRTAKPADSTRYWVGGTGNWSDTNRWSTSSGGAGGADLPRSHDDVVFDSASNATAYTATVNAVTGGIRMKALTIAGPASGNVTLAGSTAMVGIHGNVTLPATGLTRTYTGAITLSGSTTGKTFTTNGVAMANTIFVDGYGCGWSLGSALELGTNQVVVNNGTLDFATYSLIAGSMSASPTSGSKIIILGSSTITLSQSASISFGTNETARANLTVTAGTSQINCSSNDAIFTGNNQTFYNVSFTNTSTGTVTLNGANSFNNLSFTGITAAGMKNIALTADQTVTGTLTFSAGTNATMRHLVSSNTIGTTCTITAAAVSATDVDFRDITIAGAAAPVSGTRIGDCKGNSGITFDAPKTVYWNLAAGGNWGGAIAWATTSGGTPAINNFPLAQDTAVITDSSPANNSAITINKNYNLPTIDATARTLISTFVFSTSTSIYGDLLLGTGTQVTYVFPTTLIFSGRNLQKIKSSGNRIVLGNNIEVNSPGGTVSLEDNLLGRTSVSTLGTGLILTSGTFDANNKNITINNFSSNNSNVRTLNLGSGIWDIVLSGTCWNAATSTNLTVTGTGTISLTSASSKTFAGGSVDYSGITLDQGGAGTLTITGNNTFKTISSTATGVTTIAMGTTTQRITTAWTARRATGNILTVQGTSATSPCTLVFTGSGQAADVDYLAITGVRAYNLDSTWYAGANSTNNGSLGWIFSGAPVIPTNSNFFMFLM